MLSLGIDTGGTYTDAVIIDHETGEIHAKGKSPTTKEDLSIGITKVIEGLPSDMVAQIDSITLSTTLATNACVEGKGGRAKLMLVGTTAEILTRINAEQKYGLKSESVLCIDSYATFDGGSVEIPAWETVYEENKEWFSDAEALAISELYAFNTGAVREKSARDYFADVLNVPIVLASEIVNDPNIMERGATALLNARLLTVIEEFVSAVRASVQKEKQTRMMIMRSDCTLMTVDKTLTTPVETILSGPAASTVGGVELGKRPSSIIVDIGGTTTDISIIKEGNPKLSEGGIRIGGWRTQIKGVFVDTFSLGGDSAFRFEEGGLALSSRRAVPICVAAQTWPEIKADLERLAAGDVWCRDDMHEYLCLVREPEDTSSYTEQEIWLIDILKNGPWRIGHICDSKGLHRNRIRSERLESEGILIRSTLTPTDMMHVFGDYDLFDTEASRLMAQFFIQKYEVFEDLSVEQFAQHGYDVFCEKLYCGIVRILLEDQYPDVFTDLDDQMLTLIEKSWHSNKGGIIDLNFVSDYALIGVGAPTHIFLPRVAEALNAAYVIPDHAEVANAIGAALAKIRVVTKITIGPLLESEVQIGHVVYSSEGRVEFKEIGEAKAYAQKLAAEEAEAEARRRGAQGEITVESGINHKDYVGKDGTKVAIDIHAWAIATSSNNVKEAVA